MGLWHTGIISWQCYNAFMTKTGIHELQFIIDHALKILSQRPQSVFELKMKLSRYARRKKIENVSDHVEQVIQNLSERDIVNDELFAQWYVQERQDFRPRSKIKLRKELADKGIERSIISSSLERYYDEELACRNLAHQKRHMDTAGRKHYLIRQGFPYELVDYVLAGLS